MKLKRYLCGLSMVIIGIIFLCFAIDADSIAAGAIFTILFFLSIASAIAIFMED